MIIKEKKEINEKCDSRVISFLEKKKERKKKVRKNRILDDTDGEKDNVRKVDKK